MYVSGLDVRSFKVIGLWQMIVSSRGGGHGRRSHHGDGYFVAVNAVLMSLFLPYVVTQLLSFGFHYDFFVLMEKISVNLTLVESILKFFYCCIQRRYLAELSQVFDRDFLECATQDLVTSNKILNESSRMLTNNINIFIIVIFATVAVWNSLPIFKCFTENGCANISIMPSWYPMSTGHAPVKQLVYACEFIIMCYCASLLYNINCLLLSYARLLVSQIHVLETNIINIETNSRKRLANAALQLHKSPPVNRTQVHQVMDALLRDCLVDHQKVVRFAALMEKVFSPLFLFQIIVSTLTLCLVCISLTAQTTNSASATLSLAMAFKFAMYFLFGVMELLVYCWCGHLVLEQTKSLHNSFYESSWISGSETFKKKVLIATIRTTRPSYFTAGKFCDIDLKTFASVMKASFSYFTFLYGINSKK